MSRVIVIIPTYNEAENLPLIVPAVLSQLFTTRLVPRLVIGWVVSLVAAATGLALSWVLDAPAGATVVVTFGGLLFAAFAFAALRGALGSIAGGSERQC